MLHPFDAADPDSCSLKVCPNLMDEEADAVLTVLLSDGSLRDDAQALAREVRRLNSLRCALLAGGDLSETDAETATDVATRLRRYFVLPGRPIDERRR